MNCEVGGRIASCGIQMSGADWLLVFGYAAIFVAGCAIIAGWLYLSIGPKGFGK